MIPSLTSVNLWHPPGSLILVDIARSPHHALITFDSILFFITMFRCHDIVAARSSQLNCSPSALFAIIQHLFVSRGESERGKVNWTDCDVRGRMLHEWLSSGAQNKHENKHPCDKRVERTRQLSFLDNANIFLFHSRKIELSLAWVSTGLSYAWMIYDLWISIDHKDVTRWGCKNVLCDFIFSQPNGSTFHLKSREARKSL